LGIERPIAYASRTLSTSEKSYATIKKEMLAISWSIKHFRHYLFGTKFKIVTDNRPLTWLMSVKEPDSKLVRWRLLEYELEIVYKKGPLNVVADALRRVQPELNILENVSEVATNGETIHSAVEDLQFPISEKPWNEYNIQVVIEKGGMAKVVKEILLRNKLRITWRENNFDEETIGRKLKEILKPKRTVALLIPQDLVLTIQEVY